eukprot:gene11889-8174_t
MLITKRRVIAQWIAHADTRVKWLGFTHSRLVQANLSTVNNPNPKIRCLTLRVVDSVNGGRKKQHEKAHKKKEKKKGEEKRDSERTTDSHIKSFSLFLLYSCFLVRRDQQQAEETNKKSKGTICWALCPYDVQDNLLFSSSFTHSPSAPHATTVPNVTKGEREIRRINAV